MFIKRYISFITLASFVVSCSPSYVANTRNVPLFEQAKEFTGSLSYGLAGLETQVAYAATNHIAVMANADGKFASFNAEWSRHYFGELGAGYFFGNDDVRAEVFGGYGRGRSIGETGAFGVEKFRINGFYERYFIQPSIGTNEPGFNIIFTPRLSFVNFTSFSPYFQSFNPPDLSSFLGYRVIFEPALTGRFPMGKNVRGFCQLGINAMLTKSVKDYNFSNIHLTLGVQLHKGGKQKDVD